MKARWTVFAATAALAGCSGGDGGGGGGGVAWGNVSGFVDLYVDSEFGGGEVFATFYEDIDFEGNAPPRPRAVEPDDDCDFEEFDGGVDFVPVLTYMDVGATVTANGPGATDVVADRFTDDGIYYEGYEATVDAVGEYVLSVSGQGDVEAGEIATIVVPDAIDWVGGAPVLVPGEPLELQFTPDTGATAVTIYLEHSSEDIYYVCSVEDDGEFTVPASITEELDADAYVDIENGTQVIVDFEGKKLFVSASNF